MAVIMNHNASPIDKNPVIILGSSIYTNDEAQKVMASLLEIKAVKDVSIDLEDWENIVRIECKDIEPSEIIAYIKNLGFFCYLLPDY